MYYNISEYQNIYEIFLHKCANLVQMPENQIDIFKIIEENDLTIPKVAKGSEVPQSNIYSWKHRRSKPSLEDYNKVIKYFILKGYIKTDKPASQNDATITVIVDRLAELLALKNGTSLTVEAQKIYADVETLKRLSKDSSS